MVLCIVVIYIERYNTLHVSHLFKSYCHVLPINSFNENSNQVNICKMKKFIKKASQHNYICSARFLYYCSVNRVCSHKNIYEQHTEINLFVALWTLRHLEIALCSRKFCRRDLFYNPKAYQLEKDTPCWALKRGLCYDLSYSSRSIQPAGMSTKRCSSLLISFVLITARTSGFEDNAHYNVLDNVHPFYEVKCIYSAENFTRFRWEMLFLDV